MTWQWVAIIVSTYLLIVAVLALTAWRMNHQLTAEVALKLQMEGPRPFWMQQPPRSLEEFAAMLEAQQAERDDGNDDA